MTSSRPRPSVLRLTEAAAARVRELTENAERPLSGVRVGVKKGGCAGMEYTLDAVESPEPNDDVVNEHGASVYVDPQAVLFLLGAVMDYETTKLRSGFIFQNPNEVSSCGCGESVMLKPAEADETGVPA
ncbi:Fe-S cluster assembly scaffold SufA [Bauldia sp.]|uniref:Fe-S cluster assembly scaffold SufA n=1 Tax=Bauldia sp. TaxID=2575872 RepID=UPI003BAAC983